MPQLAARHVAKLQRVHVAHLRKVCRFDVRQEGLADMEDVATRFGPRMTTCRFLEVIGQPSIQARISGRRLGLLSRLAACDHAAVRATMT
eukprot:4506549-Amphidinium_carterae.1